MRGKPKRQRGAPRGNTNSLKHGLYTAEAIARRRARFADLRQVALLDRMSALMVRLHETGLAK